MMEDIGALSSERDLARLQAEEAIERAARHAFEEWGANLKQIKTRKLYYAFRPDCTWEQYCQERWEMSVIHADRLIDAYEIANQIRQLGGSIQPNWLPVRESHVRPLAMLTDGQQRADVWNRVVALTGGHDITAKVVEAEVERYKAELAKTYITLTEWSAGARWHGPMAALKMNEQEGSDRIEWAAWSWNPVTGCAHGCSYCYAKDIANRFYPHGFEPTFHPQRIASPLNQAVQGPRWAGDIGYQGVFVCSMSDLFGEWVPQEWIDSVMETVRKANQWTFIFLSKNPKRMATIDWPLNAWVGATVDRQARVQDAEAMAAIDAPVRFISCEPLLEPLTFGDLSWCQWLIVGAQSRTVAEPEFQPPWAWAEQLLWQARNAGCKVYLKPNFTGRPREYP